MTGYAINLYCACGHYAVVTLPEWMHRDYILPRARCTKCGKRGAEHMTVYVGKQDYKYPEA